MPAIFYAIALLFCRSVGLIWLRVLRFRLSLRMWKCVWLDEKCHFNHWCDRCISKSHIDWIAVVRACVLIGRYVISRRMHLFELTTKTWMTINFPIVTLWDFQFSHEKRALRATRSGRGNAIICNWAHSFPSHVFFFSNTKKLWLFYLIVIQIIVSSHIVRLQMHNLSRRMIVSHLGIQRDMCATSSSTKTRICAHSNSF